MQVYDLRSLPTVKRDMDLLRELLLNIENDPKMDCTTEFYYDNPEQMGIHERSTEEVAYHLRLLIESGYVNGAVTMAVPMQIIRGLTNSGHDFLANISNDTIWNKVKKQAGEISDHLALPVVAAIAEAIVKKQFKLT